MARPHFVVSDLHMGDGGPRDNFAYMSAGRREQEFWDFLDYVQSENGTLSINGDLFELWQSNTSKVLTYRLPLLDKLAEMDADYVLGNHDIDLLYLTDSHGLKLSHPLFDNLLLELPMMMGGLEIILIHGHMQDKYCSSETPGIGRASAIYSGIKEDRNGSPISRWKYGAATVEGRSLGRFARIGTAFRRLLGEPSHTNDMRYNIFTEWTERCCDALIYGHTHEPGQFYAADKPLPIFNSGTWAETTNSFVRIEDDGTIQVMDWTNGDARPNRTRLTF